MFVSLRIANFIPFLTTYNSNGSFCCECCHSRSSFPCLASHMWRNDNIIVMKNRICRVNRFMYNNIRTGTVNPIFIQSFV